jgi:acetyl esterase/lipase
MRIFWSALFSATLLPTISLSQTPMEIQLYDTKPPGSENWTWREGMNDNNSVKTMTVYNVVRPTLTVLKPDRPNGTAVIICPGGGFHFLAINHEGYDTAKELLKHGITVFILKYRLVHISGDNPFDDMLHTPDHKAWDAESLPIIPLAIADGRRAIQYVRTNASKFNLQSDRIGMMGFSAGGLVAISAAFDYTSENRPDFVAPIYGDMPDARLGEIKSDTPPLFIACAQDDEFGFATHALNVYEKWYDADRSVELHLFAKGGHGFGKGNPENSTGSWIQLFLKWLAVKRMM